MEGEEHNSRDQNDVNESRGNVKCEKSEQPKNNQKRGDYSEHMFSSFFLGARQSEICLSRTGRIPLLARSVAVMIILPDHRIEICSI
jgi:hypothetical protein